MQPTSHHFLVEVSIFLKGNVCGEIFFIVFKICQAGWFIWRASTNPQIWQLFLQATSQVMTAHNLFAPSHSAVLPFGFILKLIPDANLAVHYCILSLRDKTIITFCQLLVNAYWVPHGSVGILDLNLSFYLQPRISDWTISLVLHFIRVKMFQMYF